MPTLFDKVGNNNGRIYDEIPLHYVDVEHEWCFKLPYLLVISFIVGALVYSFSIRFPGELREGGLHPLKSALSICDNRVLLYQFAIIELNLEFPLSFLY